MRSSKWYLATLSSLVLLSQPVFAEHTESTSPEDAPATSGRRVIEAQIDPREVALISKVFDVPTEIVKERYGKTIPEAIEKARPKSAGGQGDETEISKIVAELVGTRSNDPKNDQMKKVVMPAVEAEMKTELDKSEGGTDKNRYLDFLKRLFWAGKVVEGKPVPKDEAQQFNKKIKADIKENQKQVEKIYSKVKDALAGNNSAKAFLREQVNRGAILSFIEGQRKAGNGKVAAQFADALSWKIDGQKFLDMQGPNGETQRLYLGKTTADVSKALKTFSDAKKSFAGASLAEKPHEGAPSIEWYIKDGKFTKGRPAGVKIAEPEFPQPVAAGTQPGTIPVGQRSTNSTSPNQPGSPAATISLERLTSTLKTTCTRCHGGSTVQGPDLKSASFLKGGVAPRAASEILAAIQTVPQMAKLKGSQVEAEIKAWAAQQ